MIVFNSMHIVSATRFLSTRHGRQRRCTATEEPERRHSRDRRNIADRGERRLCRDDGGAIILTELTTILIGFNIFGAQEQLILGLVIVLVVLVYGRESHIRMRI